MFKYFIKLNMIMGMALFFISCASSMTPIEVNNTLPTLTKSKLMSQQQAEAAIKTGNCKYLVKGRSYMAPIGLTTKNDLKNGAKGIDEWLEIDGGNAYVLTSYKWITVDDDGTTQLQLEFDTLLCE